MDHPPSAVSKSSLARSLGVSRSSLYYVSRKTKKDWLLKARIEGVLREHPAYGSRSIADALHLNRKGVKRVMNKFGIRPYRRRGRKWRKKKSVSVIYPNLLQTIILCCPHHIWATDFTELLFHGTMVYVATVIDLYTRQIVGLSVALRKGATLTIQALSFYSKFKVDLGDPNRFETLSELVAEVYRTVWVYNHTRIHSVLRMSPRVFAEEQTYLNSQKSLRLSV